MKKIISSIIIVLCGFYLNSTACLFAQPEEQGLSQALVILSASTLPQMQEARKQIEQAGGKVELIFPPSAFIGGIPFGIKNYLLETASIKEIIYTKAELADYSTAPEPTKDAIRAWNSRLEPEEAEIVATSVAREEAFVQDILLFPTDLPKAKQKKPRKTTSIWPGKKKPNCLAQV